MANNGYAGKILRIDLTEQTVATESLDEGVLRFYLGGRGIGAYLAYRELTPNLDPFSPEGSLYFITGPLQGTLTPFAPKFVMINKSPLSGSLSRSLCGGGGFGPELKYAGYDAVIIKGKAAKPVYLWIEKIARRDGFGDLLAEGTKRVSEAIGKESSRFAMHSKGQELAAYDPRALVGMGLLYATATPGANHSFGPTLTAERVGLKDMLTHRGKGRINRIEQNRYCLQDSMIFCSFSRFGMDDVQRLRLTNAVTGWNYSDGEATTIADRIYTLERLFNIREGFSKKDDGLPWRCLNEPMPDGPAQGNTVPLEAMLTDYYRERGWNERTGAPERETVERLGLAELAGEFQ